MSAERPIDRPAGNHVHLDEPSLVEAALDPEATVLRAQVAACAECSRRSSELGGFAAGLRTTLLAPAADERAFAERVLSRTTREDLSHRGDLRLVLRFAADRLRSSSALRAAAAILVVHLAALPVLAWIVLRAPQRRGEFTAHIEAPTVPTFPSEREPERELSVPWPDTEPSAIEVEPLPRGEEPWRAALRRSDLAAQVAAAPFPWSAKPPQDALAQLLWVRAARLHGQEVPEWVWSRSPEGEPSRLAVWCEVLLDEWASSGARPLHLDALLARLLALPEFQRSRLVGCALQRAAALGAVDPARVVAHAAAGTGASEVARRAGKEALEGLWREALADHVDPSSAERRAALAAWGATAR